MPTQEERLGKVEYSLDQFKTETLKAYRDMAFEMTMVKGLCEDSLRRMLAMNQRLDSVDHRLNGVDERLESMDKRFDGVDKRLDGVDKRLDGMDQEIRQRFDAQDKRFDSMDSKFDQVLRVLSTIASGLQKGT